MKGNPDMSAISAGDILFIVLVGALIWGIMLLVNSARHRKNNKDPSPPT
jgi:hypothetical protein